MYILISIFYISLIGIVAMILLKNSELKKGTTSLSSRMSVSVENFLAKTSKSIHSFVKLLNRRTFIALMQFLTFHLLFRVRRVYVELKHRTLQNPHGRKMIDAVRGRGEVKNHGASFYLRRISER